MGLVVHKRSDRGRLREVYTRLVGGTFRAKPRLQMMNWFSSCAQTEDRPPEIQAAQRVHRILAPLAHFLGIRIGVFAKLIKFGLPRLFDLLAAANLSKKPSGTRLRTQLDHIA